MRRERTKEFVERISIAPSKSAILLRLLLGREFTRAVGWD